MQGEMPKSDLHKFSQVSLTGHGPLIA